MKQQYHILLIEDHLITIDAYKSILETMPQKFNIYEAYNIDRAISLINSNFHLQPFDIAFVDINLPKSTNTAIETGEELAIELKKKFPAIKIIIPTQHNQAERIRYIINSINPEALLLKDEFRSSHISSAVQAVLNNELYFSPKVYSLLKMNDLKLDVYDLKILRCLARGVLLKDISSQIPLSHRAIEERKSLLLIKLDVRSKKKEELIAVAKEKGLI